MEELVASPGQRGGEGEGGAAGSSGAAGPSGAAGSAGAASSAGAAGASSLHAGDEGDDFSGAAGDNYYVASSGFNDSDADSDAGSVGEGGTERAAPSSSRSSSSPAKNAPGHLQAAHVSNGSSEGGGEGSEHGGEGSGGGDEVGGEGGGGIELGGGDRDRDYGLSADEETLRQRYMNDPLRVPTPRKRPPNRTVPPPPARAAAAAAAQTLWPSAAAAAAAVQTLPPQPGPHSLTLKRACKHAAHPALRRFSAAGRCGEAARRHCGEAARRRC